MAQYGNSNSRGNNHNDYTQPKCPIFKLYSDEKNRIIDKELFAGTAEKIAESLSGITSTRLRRFFDEVKSISRRPDFKTDFDKELAYIMLLKSKISYMIGRARQEGKREQAGLQNLKSFFMIGLEQVKDAESYLVFVTLFEAVYGFFYEKNK